MTPPRPRLSLEEAKYFTTAEGWLKLGLVDDSLRELGQIAPPQDRHPIVLHLKMQAAYRGDKWNACLETAMNLIKAEPDNRLAHISGSVALYRLGRTQEAWDLSLPILEVFKDDWMIPYNLACYAAQLGNREDALRMFALALDRGNVAEIKDQAFNDPDLKPIWPDIAVD